MKNSVFAELGFWLMVAVSVFLPLAIHGVLMTRRAVFVSEVSFALYLFPLMFGGIGVNMVSHVLVNHLTAAENRFAKEHSNKREPYA